MRQRSQSHNQNQSRIPVNRPNATCPSTIMASSASASNVIPASLTRVLIGATYTRRI